MRRSIAILFIVCTLVLAGCGGGSSSGNGTVSSSGGAQKGLSGGNSYIACPGNTNTPAAPAEQGTVTLNVAGATSSPAEEALVVQNLNKFQQLHPNIKINWQDIGTGYTDKMRANIASGNVPDVFYLQPDMATEYIPAGKLLNLSPYMARDNVQSADYYSSLLNPFSCKGGQIYGLPKDWNSLAVFYNKQMFQAAGVSFPDANWTWNDMLTDAKKLTRPGNAATSVYGITLSPDASRWAAFLFADGGSMLNKDGTQATFNSQAGVDSLNFYTGFEKDGSAVIPADVGAGWAGDAFGKQRAAMALEGGWLIPYMTQNFPGVQYGIAPVPLAPTGKRADLIYTNAWGAYASSAHPDAAWQLIKYMTGKEVQTVQLHAGFALPSLKSLASDAYFTENPGFKVMFDAATYSYADNYGPHDLVIHNTLADAIEKVLLGKADAKTALNEAADIINNDLQS
ncbi:MAG TPA: ABC transporter substrate-binding protein [Ktedonobacteraceae bacterium]|nr:ABC transporter substrate-binding protein [Ktedonobacteraceae bacterium]